MMRSRKSLEKWQRENQCIHPNCKVPRWPNSLFCRHHHEEERALIEQAKGQRNVSPKDNK